MHWHLIQRVLLRNFLLHQSRFLATMWASDNLSPEKSSIVTQVLRNVWSLNLLFWSPKCPSTATYGSGCCPDRFLKLIGNPFPHLINISVVDSDRVHLQYFSLQPILSLYQQEARPCSSHLHPLNFVILCDSYSGSPIGKLQAHVCWGLWTFQNKNKDKKQNLRTHAMVIPFTHRQLCKKLNCCTMMCNV